MRILVTGHRGYIGAVLAPFLAGRGHDVVGLDSDLYRGCDFGAERAFEQLPTLALDVRDVTPAHLEGFDAVVHLAALSNDPVGELDPGLTFDINLEGTLRLAGAAAEAGVRGFVFASSCSMYGASESDALLDETAPLQPLTAYAESKVRAEERLLALAGAGFAPVSMRNATVYGVSPRLRLDVVLNNLAGWAHATGRIRLLSDGSSWRPLVHVRDVARATEAILEADPALVAGEAFNVGSTAQNYRVRELAEIVGGATGCEIELASDASPDPRSYRVDFAKLERTLPGFATEWDARRGAAELVEAYRQAGLDEAAFDGPRFVRLRRIRECLDAGRLGRDLRWQSGAASSAETG